MATAADPGDTTSNVAMYVEPVVLDASVQVKARARTGNTWTAMNGAIFAVGPVAESLRISELMYHPADDGDPDDPNTEYVELTNIGAETINLNLVKFADGVDFTFPNVELAPGDCTVVVRDLAAFESRYGQDLPVLVTTDSILHTVHQSYSALLQSLEMGLIGPMLEELLTQTAQSIASAPTLDQPPAVNQAQEDLLVYLRVALALLHGERGVGPEVAHYCQLAMDASAIEEVSILGARRPCLISFWAEIPT